MGRLDSAIDYSNSKFGVIKGNHNKMQWLYAMHLTDANWVKIGITCYLRRRYHKLKHDVKAPEGSFKIVGLLPNITVADEKSIHRKFNDYRIIDGTFGKEWFQYNKEIANFIDIQMIDPMIYSYKWQAIKKYV